MKKGILFLLVFLLMGFAQAERRVSIPKKVSRDIYISPNKDAKLSITSVEKAKNVEGNLSLSFDFKNGLGVIKGNLMSKKDMKGNSGSLYANLNSDGGGSWEI